MPEESDPRKLFDACVASCADSMYRVAWRLTGHVATAEDLVQESYTQAWKNIDALRDPKRMRSWLFAILRNQYLKTCRTKSPMTSNVFETIEDQQLDRVQKTENVDLVQRAIEQLDENQRLPILLVSMEGLSVEEAAEILNVPRGTVLSRMHRGRKRLKEIIEQEQTVL